MLTSPWAMWWPQGLPRGNLWLAAQKRIFQRIFQRIFHKIFYRIFFSNNFFLKNIQKLRVIRRFCFWHNFLIRRPFFEPFAALESGGRALSDHSGLSQFWALSFLSILRHLGHEHLIKEGQEGRRVEGILLSERTSKQSLEHKRFFEKGCKIISLLMLFEVLCSLA